MISHCSTISVTRQPRRWQILASLATAIAATLALASPASADPLPGGNWRQYCTNAYMDGHDLKAHCRNANGRIEAVEANVEQCRGVVSYDVRNTKFYCANYGAGAYGPSYGPGYAPGYGPGYGPGQGSAYPIPAGAYRQYCTNVFMDGEELKGTCRRADGSYRHTEANISECRGGAVAYSIEEGRFRCASYGSNWR